MRGTNRAIYAPLLIRRRYIRTPYPYIHHILSICGMPSPSVSQPSQSSLIPALRCGCNLVISQNLGAAFGAHGEIWRCSSHENPVIGQQIFYFSPPLRNSRRLTQEPRRRAGTSRRHLAWLTYSLLLAQRIPARCDTASFSSFFYSLFLSRRFLLCEYDGFSAGASN